MIFPLLPYRIQGAIWYQGEANTSKPDAYRELFPALISQWRRDWKQGDFPFLYVQLPPFKSVAKEPMESNWAELREVQRQTLKLKNVGMAVITDYGCEYDIHPTPKQPVGERLSLLARAKVYGENIESSGPVYKDMKATGNLVTLSFQHADKGMIAMELEPTQVKAGGAAWRVKPGSTQAKLLGFEVCGRDRKFHPASAEIVGSTVLVRSPKVSQPVCVRYGWADHPLCNLFNREGLPASPFQSETLRDFTEPAEGEILPNLYVLAIGISKYPQNPLDYAAKDAQAFAQALSDHCKPLFRSAIVPKVLLDEKATKTEILKGLSALRREMTQRDIGIVFFAGHGLRDNDGLLYLQTHDTDPADLLGTGLPSLQIRAALDSMPGRVLLFVDACHAGAVDKTKARAALPEDIVRDLVTDEKGVTMMLAATGREFALESSEHKHGMFTLALVEGLSGKATKSKEGVVYFHHLDAYVTDRVKELSLGRQHPVTTRTSSVRSFPLSKPK